MKLIVTGSPGSGKTTLAKKLAKQYNLEYFNEKDFALKNGIGSFNEENELEIPIEEFEKKANSFLSSHENIVFEGHVLCEMKLDVEKVVLLTIDPEELEMRLEQRKYPMEKVMDNVFCEGIEYCKKRVFRNYPPKKVITIKSSQNSEDTFKKTIILLSA